MDETLYSFYSKRDETSPQRFIPRKPRKNGMLVYYAGFKTPHGVYLFDLEPDTNAALALNPRTALLLFLQRWSWPIQPRFTTDPDFSRDDIVLIAHDFGSAITCSINYQHRGWLYSLLNRVCPPGHKVVVQDREGVAWSMKKSTDGTHFIATTISTNISIPVQRSDRVSIGKLAQLPPKSACLGVECYWSSGRCSIACDGLKTC